jgi:beta-glucosidase
MEKYKNASLRALERAKNLVSRMSIKEKASQLRYNAPAIDRLGIPVYNWWNETLHGVERSGTATMFPQAIGFAAAFDADLIFQVADVCGTETRAKYNQSVRHGDGSG